MKRPDKKDYETSGSMINPYGSYNFEAYANELEKYSNYLESKVKNLGIHIVSNNEVALDLRELEQRLDDSLDRETSESLKKWIESQRQ